MTGVLFQSSPSPNDRLPPIPDEAVRRIAMVSFWHPSDRSRERFSCKFLPQVEFPPRKTAQNLRICAKIRDFPLKIVRFSRLHLAGCSNGDPA
ncbi:hypothetical protein GJ654_10945 [Rhodoblastus acidophilus]|uniref:Uncharacterized protein n=1 Tax=Rhodoblastus acidophilus TaxID=1074 RepID=A0A6N8DLP7_RHOAC|nr:hypothetical protein [Rhodoblastus acidophilus]MCW2274904.1 hypothetical protein [Rhodoblastus acidophilus]MTV31512.1 hypothetical protein [Rhodoblastus acidophilus]